nr:hypothetical protein CFP56_12059 [Quercus suber]
MQTIWNRIALKSGMCGCPQCVQSVQAVSRRATTTATRRPRYPTSSTLWYSGVFAAAATYDASVKQKRREQWDQAIAGVKEELGQSADIPVATSEEQSTPQTSSLSATVANVVDLFQNVEPLHRPPLWPINTGAPLIVRHVPPESLYASDDFKKRAEGARWAPKKLERAQLSMDILQLVLWKEVERLKGGPNALSTLPLPYRKLLPTSPRTADEAIQTKLAHLDYLKTIHTLDGYSRHEQDVALCHYDQDEHGSYLDQVRQLNRVLQALFTAHQNKHITTTTLLVKVAHNLHTSHAPPNLATYNTLLLGFENAEQRNVVGAVVASVRDVAARPNEVTHVCILRHYAATNNAYNFSDWVARMRGKNGGVALARPDINITDAGRSRLIPQEIAPPNLATYNTLLLGFENAEQRNVVGAVVASVRDVAARPNEVTHVCILRHYAATNNAYNFSDWVARMRGKNGGVALARPDINITDAGRSRLIPQEKNPEKIIQLPYPTPQVFGAIIEGTLKFAGFDTALRICEGMGGEGWGLCMSGMTPLLRECADERDWTSGLAVWHEILALRARDNIRNRSRKGNRGLIELPTFAAMLLLCSQCSQRGMFDEVWQVAMKTHRQCEKELMGLLQTQQQTYQQRMKERSEPLIVKDPFLRLSNRPKMSPAAGESDFVPTQLSELHAWRIAVRDSTLQDLQDCESSAQHDFYHLDLDQHSRIDEIEGEDAQHSDLATQRIDSSVSRDILTMSSGHVLDMFDEEGGLWQETALPHVEHDAPRPHDVREADGHSISTV